MILQSKEWQMPLFIEAYTGIISHGKAVEGRVPDFIKPEKDYRPMKEGDILKFFAIDKLTFKPIDDLPALKFEVQYVRSYPTVDEMLAQEGLEKLLPGVSSIEEGKQIYLGFPGYSERVKQFGIYAIGLGKKISE